MAILTEKGQVVIPASIRKRYGLTPGTQVEFVDDGDGIRLRIQRPVAAATVAEGYGMIRLSKSGKPRRLSEFDPASLLEKPK
ncbi:MAG: AbrB/MazE/SpoVT family DNA-binding domain-containing protein [Wenzhouxiangella sp.]|nr:AbrB/MazE/SpoVT family DNA-binding domain-containing protein [Wenzhouxiangella sp.]MCH8477131.1 AbrB/MazE/SpoVT family DNA-binding domain-containing protein [Wenzhouxiangella sp.]